MRQTGGSDASADAARRPFLRWAGSKQRVLDQVEARVPKRFDRYYEPFLGAGSLFFRLRPSNAVVADVNARLVETYLAVRDNPKKILEYLDDFDPLDKQQYYEVRGRHYRGRFQRAAVFIYLNRTCWNGLYRVNSKGEFNVPYGSPQSSNLVESAVLLECSRTLNNPGVEIVCADFAEVLESAGEGDFIFLDPPYVTGHNNNGFIDYNERLFSWADQERLASLASDLQQSGAYVVVTNAHHQPLLDLYPRFNLDVLSRYSTLAGSKANRRPVREALLWQHPARKEHADGIN